MFGKLMDKATHQFDKAKLAVTEACVKGARHQNGRNNAMVGEMKQYKDSVMVMRKEITECGAKVQTSLGVMSGMLSTALPCAYEATADGPVASDSNLHMAGEGSDLGVFETATQIMMDRLQAEVLDPLDMWTAAFRQTKEKNLKLEAIRVEWDAQLNAVISAEEGLKAGKKDAILKLEAEKSKERVMNEEFTGLEAEVFNEMLQCLQQILDLRRYTFLAVGIMKECFAAVAGTYDAKGPPIAMKLPPPAPVGGARTSQGEQSIARAYGLPNLYQPKQQQQPGNDALPTKQRPGSVAPPAQQLEQKPGPVAMPAKGQEQFPSPVTPPANPGVLSQGLAPGNPGGAPLPAYVEAADSVAGSAPPAP